MKILVIRFSALGDVAIALNVLQAAKEQNPELDIYVLTKKNFAKLFEISDIKAIGVDLKRKHTNLLKIFWQLKKYKFDLIIDLHSVLRSWFLDSLFFFTGHKVKIFDKGRKERKQLVKKKIFRPLKPIYERYKEVFTKSDINITLDNFKPKFKLKFNFGEEKFLSNEKKNIGIAPFAAHKTKQYPLELMEKVISELDKLDKYNILIFGGGKKEQQIAEKWENNYRNVKSVVNKFSLPEEVSLISKLNLILTMDSANMHLASLAGTKTITIWGGTHPYAGFIPFGTYNPDLTIQKNLSCRPCSIFGKETCERQDFACLTEISPKEIVNKILSNID